MKKFLKTFFMTLLIFTFCMNTLIGIASFSEMVKVSVTQDYMIDLQTYFNELNIERNKLLEEKFDLKTQTDQMKNETEKILLEGEIKKIKKANTDSEKQLKEEINKLETKIPVLETKPSYEYIKSMVVRVLNVIDEESGKVSTGTGTIVKVTEDFTYILTNKHVAPKDAKLIQVEKNAKKYTAEVIKNGVTRDLSLIRIVGKIPGTVAIKGLKKVKEQDKVYSIGMYVGQYNIYTEGTVAGWINTNNRLMNLPCLFGCSGSGVFDKDGYLVAVVYAGTQYNPFGFDTAKAWCVPYIGISAFLEEIL